MKVKLHPTKTHVLTRSAHLGRGESKIQMATQAEIPTYEKGSQGADVGHARCFLHDWGVLGAGASAA